MEKEGNKEDYGKEMKEKREKERKEKRGKGKGKGKRKKKKGGKELACQGLCLSKKKQTVEKEKSCQKQRGIKKRGKPQEKEEEERD